VVVYSVLVCGTTKASYSTDVNINKGQYGTLGMKMKAIKVKRKEGYRNETKGI
jgi:hypothetical protein